MPENLWKLLLVMVALIPIAILVQDRYKNQTLKVERSKCIDEREKLEIEASQLKQQLTQVKQRQQEADREVRGSSRKLATLEDNLEALEDERTAWNDERDRLVIGEKQLKKRYDLCKDHLKIADSTNTEEKTRRLKTESDLVEIRTKLLQCKLKTRTHEVLPENPRSQSDGSAFKTKKVPTTGHFGYTSYPVLTKKLKTETPLKRNEWINGMAIMNEDIFAVISGSNTIEHFDSTTLSTKPSFTLSGFENLQDLQSCNHSKILFVIDKESSGEMFIASLNPYNQKQKIIDVWAVDGRIERLSVTEDCHVVVAFPDDNKIHEYSSTGHLIQEIILRPEIGILKPRLALKMSNGKFLVSYDGINRKAGVGLAILNSKGHVLKSYSDPSQEKEYVNAMAIDRLGNILVAQMFSGRVVLLSSDLEYKRKLVSREHGIGVITAALLDEVNGRLFVADCNFNMRENFFEDSRILVFDMRQSE